MKNRLIFLIVLSIYILNLTELGLIAQTDSIKIEISEDITDYKDFKYKKKYQYLDINLREERSIFKIATTTGLYLIASDDYAYNKLRFYPGIETKIVPSVSLLLQASTLYMMSEDAIYLGSKLDLQFRYYYAIKRRMEQGISANNFNGTYFNLYLSPMPPIKILDEIKVYREYFSIGWGIQQRIGTLGYIDALIYSSYNEGDAIGVGVIIFFGLGFAL